MTIAELVARLTAQAGDAERLGRLALEAAILRDVLDDLAQLDGVPTRPTPDTLITLEEAAARLDVTQRWLREERPPYVVIMKDGKKKTLRVSEQKLARWLAHSNGG